MTAYTLYNISGKGDLKFYWTDQEIYVDNTMDDISAQELIDGIRTVEDSTRGILHGKIANATGKDDLGGGISVGITLTLQESWVLYSEKSSGFFTIKNGNILRHDATTPFKANTSITYQQILVQGATIVTVNSGSGLSAEEHNKLIGLPQEATIADEVWTSGTTSDYGDNSFGTRITKLLTLNQFFAGS